MSIAHGRQSKLPCWYSEFCASFWDEISWNEIIQIQESQGVSAWVCLKIEDTKKHSVGNMITIKYLYKWIAFPPCLGVMTRKTGV